MTIYGVIDGRLSNPEAILWLMERVSSRTSEEFDSRFQSSIFDIFRQNTLAELLTFHSKYSVYPDDKQERLRNLVIQESVLFYNFGVDHYNQRTPLDVVIDVEAFQCMARARVEFQKRLPELIKSTRGYWEDELPQYWGEVFHFHSSSGTPTFPPTVSIGIISIVEKRLDALFRRVEEINQVKVDGGHELVLTIADTENLTDDIWARLRALLASVSFPVTLICSRPPQRGELNSITIDRNSCFAFSSGRYQVFIDDDVRLVGPVIENLVQILDERPEIGIVSIASYNKSLGILKPIYPRKYFIDDLLMITDRVLGNIMATRQELVRVIPFNPLLKNLGDDQHLVRQIFLLGFLGAYILPNNAYVLDEDLGYSATRNAHNLARHLVEEGLKFYFSPETYDELQAAPAAFLARKFAGNRSGQAAAHDFWAKFRFTLLKFLQGERERFDFVERFETDEFVVQNLAEIRKAVTYYQEEWERIRRFRSEQYDPKNLSKVDPSRGALTFFN